MVRTCPSCSAENLMEDFRFCPYCGVELRQDTVCPNCGYRPDHAVKFCPECGTALQSASKPPKTTKARQEKGAEVTEMEPTPPQDITIEFLYSSSSSFDFAVQAAQALPGFRQFGEGNKAIYRVNFSIEHMDTALELVEYLKGWRRRTVYVDGEKVPWDPVFQFAWCYQRKKSSYKPEFYCFGYDETYQLNPWGCIRAGLPFRERAEWCTWGRWLNKRGDWEFDKERMRHELDKNLHNVRFCPALQPALIGSVLEAFPSTVNPQRDKDWKFVQSWDNTTPGLTVTVKEYGYTQEATMVGAEPNGTGALHKIMRQVKGFRLPLPPGN